MKNLKKLEDQLEELKKKISEFEIDSRMYDFLKLSSERNKLIEKINKTKWKSFSPEEKTVKRMEDLELTEKYFKKFNEDVKQKYLFKKNYIELVEKVNQAYLTNKSPLLHVLLNCLNQEMYLDFNRNNCIQIIIDELVGNEVNSEINELLDSFRNLLKLSISEIESID